MRYVVIGAGAVGGVVGALLHRSGREVVLVARGEHLEAMRANGLRLLTPAEDVVVPVTAVGSVDEVQWADGDVALLAVKSDATADLLATLAAVAPASTPLVCLQNGVANEPAAQRWFDHVYGVCVMAPTGHLEPGVVEAACSPVAAILDIGCFPSGVDDLARAVAADVGSAGMVSVARPDIMSWKHRKLMLNLGNAVQALCQKGSDADRLSALARDEGERVLAAAGIDVVSVDEDRERRGDILRHGPVPGGSRAGGSSWQSLSRGTGRIESDWLNGEVVRLGRLHGVPTPVNALLQSEARRAASEHRAPGLGSAATYLQALGSDGA